MNRIDKPNSPHAAEKAPEFNFANAVNDLCQLLGKADALAHATEDLFDEPPADDADDVRRHRERVSHLITNTAEAVQTARDAGNQLADHLAKRRMGA
jgi:hypothetical protein